MIMSQRASNRLWLTVGIARYYNSPKVRCVDYEARGIIASFWVSNTCEVSVFYFYYKSTIRLFLVLLTPGILKRFLYRQQVYNDTTIQMIYYYANIFCNIINPRILWYLLSTYWNGTMISLTVNFIKISLFCTDKLFSEDSIFSQRS